MPFRSSKNATFVAFDRAVEPRFRKAAELAIRNGAFLIFGGPVEGAATLLLRGEPYLVAVAYRSDQSPTPATRYDVIFVREAQSDLERELEGLSQL